MAYIVTGDDTSLPVQLKKNGATFAISTGAAVTASIVTPNHATVLLPSFACISTATDANWGSSLVEVVFSAAATALITDYGDMLLELQVDDGGKMTWFAPVTIIQGNIA